MTIAAGFLYRDGVLLCTDTEVTAGSFKSQSPKMTGFTVPAGKFGFAYAGNPDFAMAAIQKCWRALKGSDESTWFETVERTLDEAYRKSVLTHPLVSNDTLWYQIIMAHRSPSTSEVFLYVTSETTIRQVVDGHVFIGIGNSLAEYLVNQLHGSHMDERDVCSIAAFILANVKANVSGCGGLSHFRALRSDGKSGEFYSKAGIGKTPQNSTEWLEVNASDYDLQARKLLLSLAHPDLDEEAFERNIERFAKKVRSLRADWRRHQSKREAFAGLDLAPSRKSGNKSN